MTDGGVRRNVMAGARVRVPSLQLVSNALYTVGAFVVGEELVNCFLH